jgi:hypothetical protein
MAASFFRKYVRSARTNELAWRYLFNLAPSIRYSRAHGSLSGEPMRVLGDLNANGVAVTSAQRLFGANSIYDELAAKVDRMEQEHAEALERGRASANGLGPIGKKTYMHKYFGDRQVLEHDSIFTRFALDSRVLGIANAYFGMYTRLRSYNVWHTFPTKMEARESQLWHRDREDRLILKVFVYLSDVDEGAGPFTYAPGTCLKQRRWPEPAFQVEGNDRRSTDAQMADSIPPEKWMKALGPRGTIVFADTHGYHKGGHAQESDRLMYVCMFTSPASDSEELFEYGKRFDAGDDLEKAVALAPPRPGPWLSL